MKHECFRNSSTFSSVFVSVVLGHHGSGPIAGTILTSSTDRLIMFCRRSDGPKRVRAVRVGVGGRSE